jgi:hypothetical protein
MVVGARQLAQHERVKPIRLPARDAKPIARRRDLVGVQRQHMQPRIEQPLDQHAVRPLDRDQLHLQAHQPPAQRPQPLLVMRERPSEQLVARRVRDEHIVLLRRPINAGVVTHIALLSVGSLHSTPTRRYRCETS